MYAYKLYTQFDAIMNICNSGKRWVTGVLHHWINATANRTRSNSVEPLTAPAPAALAAAAAAEAAPKASPQAVSITRNASYHSSSAPQVTAQAECQSDCRATPSRCHKWYMEIPISIKNTMQFIWTQNPLVSYPSPKGSAAAGRS